MNYAGKFSGYEGKKVVKSRRNFIYKKKEPGRIGFHYIGEAEGILLSEASIRKEDNDMDASKKSPDCLPWIVSPRIWQSVWVGATLRPL